MDNHCDNYNISFIFTLISILFLILSIFAPYQLLMYIMFVLTGLLSMKIGVKEENKIVERKHKMKKMKVFIESL